MPISTMQRRYLFWLVAGVTAASARGNASEIKQDERVVFFPTVAHLSDNGREWIAPVHGWIFEPEAKSLTRKAAMAAFRKTLGLDAGRPSTEIFERRARLFLVDNERGKKIAVRIGDRTLDLDRSAEDGHFFGTVRVDVPTAGRLATDNRLRYLAVTAGKDPRQFPGVVHLVHPVGVSVISDIDDTIKVTEVTDRRKLVENTFFLPFKPVTGMPELYRRWAGAGAEFHFVSASPWQLYEPLSEFTRTAGFPPATFHLQRVRLKDASVLSLLTDPLERKLAVIEPLLAEFPRRKFVLVGDSGERDPETYAVLAERHPDQILRIYIRDVTGQAADAPRYQAALARVPREKWQLFRDPGEIREDLKGGAK